MKKMTLGIVFAWMVSLPLWAAGTQAGTSIDNNATLSYSVNGITQNSVASNTDTFVVDRRLDVQVAHVETSAVTVTPGQTAAVLSFTVQNQGNDTQDFSLTAVANDGNPFGLTDNFDATNVNVYVDTNNNGTYDAGTDNATYIDELAPDANATVFIVADIPPVQVDNDVAEYSLVAQVAVGGTSGTQGADITSDDSTTADDAATVQNVFADGSGSNGATDAQYNGKHADNHAYQVKTAKITVTKTSCVIWDPVNITNNPKRIPLAMVRYAIQVENNGSVAATNVTLTDTLNTNLTYGQSTATGAPTAVAKVYDAACNCASPSGTDITNNPSGSNTINNSGNTVSINLGTVDTTAGGSNSKTKCAYFDVYIK